MKISKEIIIQKDRLAVWNIVAEEFHNAYEWMSIVPRSVEKQGEIKDGAAVHGRVCDLSNKKEDGPQANEIITYYNKDNFHFEFDVTPINTSSVLPIKRNHVSVRLESINNDKTLLHWDADAKIITFGNLLSPILKVGLGKSFEEVLEELKYYAETGMPHPRKAAKIAKSA
ncbi:SRPBCC family protein [Flammeovirga yaeyamensis]|uniref:SRPBCC family protein n=1 Tax=Flammeovirga yaeyamensis TaxID=367791 RepID=A0AAX1N9J5_9BACT|nr:SRPBCC family protein [Flammeovirga yaeyamensis]MBB3699385.1 hypothetical protein [Flammeovirga yaeyamensis]NMF35355.1 hypothetical protein [Flammeovirga yaeyamensis]QWG04215.1 SRPBCC family protein [Flammeovirga yaeyamensis]